MAKVRQSRLLLEQANYHAENYGGARHASDSIKSQGAWKSSPGSRERRTDFSLQGPGRRSGKPEPDPRNTAIINVLPSLWSSVTEALGNEYINPISSLFSFQQAPGASDFLAPVHPTWTTLLAFSLPHASARPTLDAHSQHPPGPALAHSALMFGFLVVVLVVAVVAPPCRRRNHGP